MSLPIPVNADMSPPEYPEVYNPRDQTEVMPDYPEVYYPKDGTEVPHHELDSGGVFASSY